MKKRLKKSSGVVQFLTAAETPGVEVNACAISVSNIIIDCIVILLALIDVDGEPVADEVAAGMVAAGSGEVPIIFINL